MIILFKILETNVLLLTSYRCFNILKYVKNIPLGVAVNLNTDVSNILVS